MKKAPSRLGTKLTLRGTTQIPHNFYAALERL